MKPKFLFALVALLLALLATACGGQAAQTVSGSFVGEVAGSNAFVAVVAHTNGEVQAYVCDGESIAAWFQGNAANSAAELTNANGDTLVVKLDAQTAQGTFTPAGGTALAFKAEAANAPAGLYRAEATEEGKNYVGGWIVLPSGEERGGFGLLGSSALLQTNINEALSISLLTQRQIVSPRD